MGARRLLVTDLDGTLLGDEAALERFVAWLHTDRDGWRLVYATGRTVDSVMELVEGGRLPGPDAIVASVGTAIHHADGAVWPGWPASWPSWDAERVRSSLEAVPGLVTQPAVHQSDRKASFHALDLSDASLDDLRRRLVDEGIDATLVYSSARDLDVLPGEAGKGAASRFLARGWGIADSAVVAAGDSGNDLDLLTEGFRSVVVANAGPELRDLDGPTIYHSPFPHAAGVLDGIRHWEGVASNGMTTLPVRS